MEQDKEKKIGEIVKQIKKVILERRNKAIKSQTEVKMTKNTLM